MGSDVQHNSTWNSLVESGYRAHLNGCFREAESIYKTALGLAKQARVIFHSSTAHVLSLLGDLYAEQEHYASGESMYRLALRVYEQIDGVEPIDTAITLKRMSAMCRLQDNVTEALDLNERAETILASMRARLDHLFNTSIAEK